MAALRARHASFGPRTPPNEKCAARRACRGLCPGRTPWRRPWDRLSVRVSQIGLVRANHPMVPRPAPTDIGAEGPLLGTASTSAGTKLLPLRASCFGIVLTLTVRVERSLPERDLNSR